MEIELTRGYVTKVDDADYDSLAAHNWYYNGRYAVRGVWCPLRKNMKPIKMHRVILGAKDCESIDHINGDGLDNRRANLRLCTHQQNMFNRRNATKPKTSIYKGVHLSRGKWRASIRFNKKLKHIGYFTSELDAAKTYDEVAKEMFGEFAGLNF
jgi:hypothetical protein